MPQPPQSPSVLSGVSQPFASLPSQLPKPGLHDAIAQVPPEHVAVAFARVQVVPHAPQLVRVSSARSQPFAPLPSQLPKPGSHASIAQVPEPQSVVAFARVHSVPQPPQLVVVRSEVSQPFASKLSQLPQPSSHDWIAQAPVEHVGVA